jgi:hypothetical protein
MFIIYNHPSISDYIYKFVNLLQTVFPLYDNILYNIRIYKAPYVLQKTLWWFDMLLWKKPSCNQSYNQMWLAGKSPINGDCNWKMAHFQLPCLITGGYLEFVSMCVYIYIQFTVIMWVLKSLCLQKYILAILYIYICIKLEVIKEAMIHYSSVFHY